LAPPNVYVDTSKYVEIFKPFDSSEAGAFIIQDATGSYLLVIDSGGKVNIKVTLTQNLEPTADTKDFVIQNSSDGLNLVLTNPEGNLLLKESLSENKSLLAPTLNSFIIQNKTGNVVAYVNSTRLVFDWNFNWECFVWVGNSILDYKSVKFI